MTQLHYATAHTEIDLHANDEHAYRFKPAAWRFVWLWWNLVLLGAVTVMTLAIVAGDPSKWSTVKDALTATTIQLAPLALALSILMAHGKVDLSLPMQTSAAAILFQWLAWTMDFNNAQHIVAAIVVVTLAFSLVGVLNWCLCTLLGAPSAVVTLVVGSVVFLVVASIGARLDWSGYRIGSLKGFLDVVAVLLRWGPVAVATVVTVLLTLWLVMRPLGRAVQTQARREAVAELAGFVMVSILCALSAIAADLDVWTIGSPSSRTFLPTYSAEGVLIAVLIGGTLYAGKLVNPLGAILASLVVATTMSLASTYFPNSESDLPFVLLRTGFFFAAAGCVILGYTRRFRSLLAASCDPARDVGRIPFLLICAAAVAVVVLVGTCVLLPLINTATGATISVYRSRSGADGTAAARVTLCLAAFGASATYLLLFTADLLMTWRIRVRK